MKIEEIRTGCVRIWLSAEDMTRYGVTYRDMARGEPRTDRMVRHVLEVVAQYTGHTATRYTVEALDAEAGCLLLVTATDGADEIQPPYICVVTRLPMLFRLAAQYYAVDATAYGTLYAVPHGYILVICPTQEDPSVLRLLYRYADRVECGLIAAASAAEYGTLIADGDALERLALTAREQPLPEQTGRRR